MSEFTTGLLFQPQYIQKVENWMQDTSLPFMTRSLNEKWAVLFVKDDWLTNESTVDLLRNLSKLVPLLNFSFAEDHGWSYRIFAEGDEAARFYENFYLDHDLAIKLANQRYPEHPEIEHFLYSEEEGQMILQSLLEEVRKSKTYKDELIKQLQTKNVEAFAVFDVDVEAIGFLDQILSIERLGGVSQFESVHLFKEYLVIIDMSWMSYDYLSKDIE